MKMPHIALTVFLLLITGCGLETKTLSEFYEYNLNDVTKIEIVDGTTGEKLVVTEKEDVQDFLKKIKNIKFIPEEDQENRKGFRYYISLFQGGNRTFAFTLEELNGHTYYTEPDILPIVDEFFHDLKVNR